MDPIPFSDNLEKALITASARASAKACFLRHAALFFCANAFLAAIDLAASPDSVWFEKPLIGWGLFLCAHGVRAFLPARKNLSQLEEKP